MPILIFIFFAHNPPNLKFASCTSETCPRLPPCTSRPCLRCFCRLCPDFFLCLLKDVWLRECTRRRGQLIQRNFKPNSKPNFIPSAHGLFAAHSKPCTSGPCPRLNHRTTPHTNQKNNTPTNKRHNLSYRCITTTAHQSSQGKPYASSSASI